MNNLEKAKQLYKDKKILILGLGINEGGVGSTRFFAQQGAQVRVTDLKTKDQLTASLEKLQEYENIEYILGQHRYEDIDWADLIIKNPAIKPENPYIKYAKQKGKQIEMDMGILLQFVSPQQIIGVTGTKGKSTTSSLIYEILSKSFSGVASDHLPGVASKNNQQKVVFAGNIGKSVLDLIPYLNKETLVVLELSSFQLEAFNQHQTSPKWSVITNIYPDHLNYYNSMEEYIQAKKVIALYQTENDFLFLRKDDPITSTPQFLSGIKSQIIYFSSNDLPQSFAPKLPGDHNLENMAAALAVVKKFGIQTSEALQIIKDFKGVEFRLQLILETNGIKIYNDTAATTPAAAIQALKSLPNSILIAGGVNKNIPYDEFAKIINQYAKAVFFLEGDATKEIKRQFSALNLQSAKIKGTYNNLEQLLKDVKKFAQEGDTILFSPGAASFNLFQNEFDRGRKFNDAVFKIWT